MLGQSPAGSSVGVLSADDKFQVYRQETGLPAQAVQTMFEDRQHTFWLGTSRGLCRWSPGSQADCLNNLSVFSLVEEANGDLLIGDNVRQTTLRLSGGTLKPAITQPGFASVFPKVTLRDHDGNIWLGTLAQGLLHLSHGRVERFTRRDGLSGDTVNALAEDREGDLWVGTVRGIDRFRDPRVVHVNSLDGLSSDVVTAVYADRKSVV